MTGRERIKEGIVKYRGLLPIIAIIILILAMAFITSRASAEPTPPPTINLAQGGNITFYSEDAQYFITVRGSDVFLNQSAIALTPLMTAYDTNKTGYAWMFGPYDSKFPIPFTLQHNVYWFDLKPEDTVRMRSGLYTVYLQVPGPSGIYGISYNAINNSFDSPFAHVPSYPLTALDPHSEHDAFVAAMNTFPSDEYWLNLTIDLEPPEVIVKDNYIDGEGNLYLGGTTNLAAGEPISATIDSSIYNNSQFYYKYTDYTSQRMTNHDFMTTYSTVQSGTYTERQWGLEFFQNRSENLPSGHHTISINLPDSVQTTIPFFRWSKPVTPIPTPQIQDYYAVDGSFYAYGSDVNTSPPEYPQEYPTPAICPVVTPEPTLLYTSGPIYETVLPNTTDNRTIPQMGTIYVGEKNLDISLAIGWPSKDTGDYTVQYCDSINVTGEGQTVTISNPYHVNIDNSNFGGYNGAWCHYDSWATTDMAEPVAFYVEPLPENVTLVKGIAGQTAIGLPYTPEPTITVNVTEAVNVTENATPNFEATPDTSGTINATPMPWWIGILAVASVIIARRKK